MTGDGKLYEELIYRYLHSFSYTAKEDIYGEPYIEEFYFANKNVFICNYKTNNRRQIDILLNFPPNNRKIAVECKDHSSRIDVINIESFITKCTNIGVNEGWFYSSSGFTKPAEELAKKSLGIKTFHIPIDQLMYLLDRNYDPIQDPVFSCPNCLNGPDSYITVDHIYHVLTSNGKYFQVLVGMCYCCFNYFCIDSLSYSITLVSTFNSNNNSHSFIRRSIKCSGYPDITYSYDFAGNLVILYKNIPCRILT